MKITDTKYQTRYFENGQPVRAQGRDSVIADETGIYGTADSIRVMDLASGRTWKLQVWRIS